MASAKVPFPVMVGPVHRLGGEAVAPAAAGRPVEASASTDSFEFEARSFHHRIPQWNQYHAKTTERATDPDALGRKLHGRNAAGVVHVDEVEVGASLNGWWFVGCIYGGFMKADNWVKITGASRRR